MASVLLHGAAGRRLRAVSYPLLGSRRWGRQSVRGGLHRPGLVREVRGWRRNSPTACVLRSGNDPVENRRRAQLLCSCTQHSQAASQQLPLRAVHLLHHPLALFGAGKG